MRSIQHPGSTSAERVRAVATQTRQVEIDLPPGRSLLDAVRFALEPFAAKSAVLNLYGGAFFPFAYALPALSKTSEHAVYFSDRFDALEPVQLARASVTYGQRDGHPWLHCHAAWAQSDGTRCSGHVLPEHAVVLETVSASVCLLDSAQFQVRHDEETRFALLKPEVVNTELILSAAPTALAVRLSPNVDVCTAIEDICREHGIKQATLHGGVGSTVGAAFDDGRIVQPFVTEVLIRDGRIVCGSDGAPRALIDVDLVDFSGGVHRGRLARGLNPVLVTFELVLVPVVAVHAQSTFQREREQT